MTLKEAQHVIRDGGAGLVNWSLAAGEIISSHESSFDDLLVCLRRGGPPASVAATALYVRTKRPRENDSLESFSMDYHDWLGYLQRNGLVLT
jgi:hypothetical protein